MRDGKNLIAKEPILQYTRDFHLSAGREGKITCSYTCTVVVHPKYFLIFSNFELLENYTFFVRMINLTCPEIGILD